MFERKKEVEKRAELLEAYLQKIKELKSAMSASRKENKDVLIPEAHLRNIQSKIDWAFHNDKVDDFQKIDAQLKLVEEEIKYASTEKFVDYFKDIEIMIMGESAHQEKILGQKSSLAQKKPEAEKASGAPAQKSADEVLKKKEERRRMMEEEFAKVPSPDKYFYLNCGHQLVSLNDFIEKLPKIPDECFAFHTAEDENHFSKWIKGVFDDDELAKKIKGVRNKQQMLKILESAKRGE